MENEDRKPERSDTDLQALMRITTAGFERVEMLSQKLDEFHGETTAELVAVNKRIDNLSYKVDQLDAKLDTHRQETKDGFDAMRRIVGGMSRTLTDHEERIKALEGE